MLNMYKQICDPHCPGVTQLLKNIKRVKHDVFTGLSESSAEEMNKQSQYDNWKLAGTRP